MTPFSKTIAIFGSSAISQDSSAAAVAYQAGKQLAQAGFAICNGGYSGVMEAASRGASEAKGQIIGITTDVFSKRSPNKYLTQTIPTPNLLERINTLMRIADGYIVLDGSIGTMAELFVAWNLVATGWEKPLIVVGDPMKHAIVKLRNFTEIEDKHIEMLTFAPTIESAVKTLQEYFEK